MYMYQHNNIIVLLIEHAKVDNIVIDLRKGNRKKQKQKTKQTSLTKKGTKPKQRNRLGWHSLKQLDDKLIVYMVYLLKMILNVQRRTNERTDLPMDN